MTPSPGRANILLLSTIASRVEREEYRVRNGQRGVVTDCKPPCVETRESAPGSEGDADAPRFGAVTGLLSDKIEWTRDITVAS